MNAWTMTWPHAHNRLLTEGIHKPSCSLTILKSEEINITLALLRRVKTNVSQVHSRVRGHIING